jgi:PucR C-terminal helix-turn-helix domain/GGDEF-like domain
MYAEGLRAALSAALSHGLEVIEQGEEHASPAPEAVLSQARLAARSGVSLNTVMRRYVAGNALLGDFLLQEAEAANLPRAVLQRVTRDVTVIFDRLLSVVTDEYTRESESRPGSTADRRAERVRRLLAGEMIDTSGFAYDFDGWHIGAVVAGPGATDAVRKLATSLRRPYLFVQGEDNIVWAWLGGQRKPEASDFDLALSIWPTHNPLAAGEPAHGPSGWRLTHRQAQAALPVALRSRQSFVRYADVALLASLFQDNLLAASLRELYLIPLSEERDGGVVFRKTLRAYLSRERNLSSAAAALGVSRRTVANRLQAIEAKLGRPLVTMLAGIEAALQFEELDTRLKH